MRDLVSAEALSELIGLIYDCVIDPERWQHAIDALRQALGFATAEITVMRLPDGAPLLSTTSGIAPDWLPRFQQSRADALDLWGGAERIQHYPLAEPIVLSQAMGRPHLEAHPMHQRFSAPLGLSDLVSVALLRQADALAGIGLGWPAAQGEIEEGHLAPLRLLAPHLRRAVTISRLLDVQRLAADTFAQALDTLACAVLLLDVSLRIVHANAPAQALLAADEALQTVGQRQLRLPSPTAQTALADAITLAASGLAALGQRGIGIPLARADGGAPRVAHVLPLRAGTSPSGVPPRAVAALFVTDAAAPAPAPLQALALLYDLTPAEARVFEGVAAGQSPQQIATQLGLASSTVKTHLLRVFAKTGCRRQSELVRLAASLAV